MLVLFFGAGISFIFLCGQSKALNVGERSLPAFLCYLEYMLKKNNKRLFTLLQPFNQLISQSYCSRQRWLVPMWRRPLAIFSWQ